MPTNKPMPHTPKSLSAIAEELQNHAAALAALAESMTLAKFDSLEITNDDQRKRAVDFIDKFINAVRKTIRDAREKRGDFTGQPGQNGAGKKKR